MSLDNLDGLAFPVVTVRYAGPTNHNGSRWIASLKRDRKTVVSITRPYNYAGRSGVANALPVALECFAAYLSTVSLGHEPTTVDEFYPIAGDLDGDRYSFTFLPKFYVEGSR